MTWTPLTLDQLQFGVHMSEWIRIARGQYGNDWLPSDADIAKSALFERLRSGKDPLSEPPPLGYSCPWYAVVEDAGPHYVYEVDEVILPPDQDILIMQNSYTIVAKHEKTYIVKDARHDTSYRFKVFFDPEWKHPNGRITGGWFMQNTALVSKQEKTNG